jgi:hypothetical protein
MAKSRWLEDPREEVRAAAKVAEELLRGCRNDMERIHVVGEILTPILNDKLILEDVFATIFGEEDWTDKPASDRKFKVPTEVVGDAKVLIYQNGQTFSQFTFDKREFAVTSEEIATPEYVADIKELNSANALATVEDVEAVIRKMLLIRKVKKGYNLLASGFDAKNVTVTVIVDDGTYGTDRQLAYLPGLRDQLEATIEEMQDLLGGRIGLGLVARQITLDQLKRIGLSADWDSFMEQGSDSHPNSRQWQPLLNPRLTPFAVNGATDDINGRATVGRPIITPGDLFLVGPGVASLALTEPLQPSVITKDHWEVAYAWRTGYAWVRWSDLGDTNKCRRFLVLRRVGVMGTARGVLSVDGLSADGIRMYCTRPVDKATISNARVIISATTGGGQATGALTKIIGGDLRHFKLTFATPLTPGLDYYVRTDNTDTTYNNAANFNDMAGDYITEMAEVVVRCA